MGFGMVCDCCDVWAGVILVIMVLVSLWFARIGCIMTGFIWCWWFSGLI